MKYFGAQLAQPAPKAMRLWGQLKTLASSRKTNIPCLRNYQLKTLLSKVNKHLPYCFKFLVFSCLLPNLALA
jgi:hypothetical protein